ncbi:3-deoxy-D-manno-octulosonate 8-phosphate phosphatase KdsC [Posidoniimonas corsicana]|uniref:3-deoxy-D-manno-octulosonate 8-phosphate phosphatase KdsC n=1 Tax=Posidoniimonas corsicana TaxID=1938618 RepID=A0A5C5VDQ4_9BACT|nr:HAD-IIIA family hydrolase [Posidoniimonas corsicana]TWT36746.1 3-deoxy-D-manno-octulosonate 8-phosphate phosphatase KdsC [Posidoniimonas corsicana]
MPLAETCRRIKLLLSDVDGVMTDGSVLYDSTGAELKSFNIRDGLGIRLWQRAGGVFGVVTGRESPMVERRCRELDVAILVQNSGDKLPKVQQIASEQGVTLDEIAYIGDDLPDLPVIQAVGLGVAVADAAEEVLHAADYTTQLPGGRGAIRELIEVILKQRMKQ